MPTYDYACQACDHEFEAFQSMTATPLRKCPECGKLRLKRLIGIGAAVIFKGSGFYETDYRSDGYKRSAKAETDAKAESKTDSTSKSADGAKKKKKTKATTGTAAASGDSKG